MTDAIHASGQSDGIPPIDQMVTNSIARLERNRLLAVACAAAILFGLLALDKLYVPGYLPLVLISVAAAILIPVYALEVFPAMFPQALEVAAIPQGLYISRRMLFRKRFQVVPWERV